jgi:hypothetical protein
MADVKAGARWKNCGLLPTEVMDKVKNEEKKEH